MWAMLMAAMAITGGDPCADSCMAWGTGPRWSIHRDRAGWSLHVEGQPPAAIVPGAWQDTPRGRRMNGTLAGGGGFTLRATFGLCRDPAGGKRTTSHFAELSLADGRVLRGCLADRAGAPYPG